MKPRERMMRAGASALSIEELIAIILRTGDGDRDVMKLAQDLVKSYPRLSDLASATMEELLSIKGIGVAKATALKAALELGKRLFLEMSSSPKKLSSPERIYEMCSDMRFMSKEILRVVGVDSSLRYIAHRDFTSSLSSVVEVGMKDVMAFLLRIGADAFFIVHNHRSTTRPSKEDEIFTSKIKAAGDILGVKLLDHIIMSPKGYYSFAKEASI